METKRNIAPEDEYLVTSIRLSRADHNTLKRIAAADRRSLSNELRHLIAIRADELNREAA